MTELIKYQGFWYLARMRSRKIQVNLRNPAKFTKTCKIPQNSLEIFIKYMSIQHIWNVSRLLLGLSNCCKLANLSWNFTTTKEKMLVALATISVAISSPELGLRARDKGNRISDHTKTDCCESLGQKNKTLLTQTREKKKKYLWEGRVGKTVGARLQMTFEMTSVWSYAPVETWHWQKTGRVCT